MIIIFGTKSSTIKENKGNFVCPQCQNLRKYSLKSIQSWFTLFFIPVFPIGAKKDRHVECEGCNNTYYEKVLEENKFNLDGTILEAENTA